MCPIICSVCFSLFSAKAVRLIYTRVSELSHSAGSGNRLLVIQSPDMQREKKSRLNNQMLFWGSWKIERQLFEGDQVSRGLKGEPVRKKTLFHHPLADIYFDLQNYTLDASEYLSRCDWEMHQWRGVRVSGLHTDDYPEELWLKGTKVALRKWTGTSPATNPIFRHPELGLDCLVNKLSP